MKPNLPLTAASLALAVLCVTPALAADAAKPAAPAKPSADAILQRMSTKLATAKTLRFEATREIDPGLIPGHNLPEKASVTAAVQRPNKIAARGESKAGARRFIFDGRTLSLLDEKKNLYATMPMRTTIDGLVDQLDQKFGFVPPLAEFALSNPYAEFHHQAHTITYLGRANVASGFLGWGSIACDHLALKGREADAELWIGADDQLPRKLVATFHLAGHPQLRIAFSAWNLGAPVAAAEFAFTPPKGAQKIEMWTVAKMQAAHKL